MRLHNTSGNISGKIAPETSGTKAPSKAASATVPKTQLSSVPKAPPSAVTRSIPSLIAAAKLPSDKLSASIISFSRFFSLPLKPELLKNIRQQAFTAGSEQGVKGEQGGGANEARALAAAASEGKGVGLAPEALEAYAQEIDPEWRRQDGQHGRRRNKDEREKEEGSLEKNGEITAFATEITANGLEKATLEQMKKNPLLAILNRLPEKDGKRWVVLPMDFSDNGREYKVSIRILLETGKTADRAGCIALDIVSDGKAESGQPNRRLFVLEPANRLSVYLQPEISPKEQAALASDLSALLGLNPGRVFIKTLAENFPFEADGGDDLLRSIDEAV
jgi:hypothetical protein